MDGHRLYEDIQYLDTLGLYTNVLSDLSRVRVDDEERRIAGISAVENTYLIVQPTISDIDYLLFDGCADKLLKATFPFTPEYAEAVSSAEIPGFPPGKLVDMLETWIKNFVLDCAVHLQSPFWQSLGKKFHLLKMGCHKKALYRLVVYLTAFATPLVSLDKTLIWLTPGFDEKNKRRHLEILAELISIDDFGEYLPFAYIAALGGAKDIQLENVMDLFKLVVRRKREATMIHPFVLWFSLLYGRSGIVFAEALNIYKEGNLEAMLESDCAVIDNKEGLEGGIGN